MSLKIALSLVISTLTPFAFSAVVLASPVMIEEAAYYRDEGRRYQEGGQIDMAIQAYQRSAQVFPENADVHNDLGVMYEAKGLSKSAEAEYLRALQIDNRHSGAHTNLALLYESQNKIDKAGPHWQERVRIGPASDPWVARARESLVKYKLEVPKPEEVVAAKERGEAALRYEEGIFFIEQKRWSEAEAAFLQALEIDPNHKGAREGLALARKRLKPSAPAGVISHEDEARLAPSDTELKKTSNVAPRRAENVSNPQEVRRQKEEKERLQKAEQEKRKEEERQKQESQRLLKQSESLTKSAQDQQTQAAQLIARSIAMQKEAEALRRKAGQAPPATTTATPPLKAPAPVTAPFKKPTASGQTVITPKPATQPVVSAPKPAVYTPPAAPKPIVPQAPSAPVVVRPSTLTIPQREIRTTPVVPITSSKEAQALADQLAKERQRTKDLMVRELNQRGLILYRQKQYPQAIEQFQRALGIDSDNRETQGYLRDAQSAQARGES